MLFVKRSFSHSYTSPDDRGDGDDVPNPTIRKANRKLEGLVDQLYAAINGDDVTPSGSGTGPWEGSGSGSGSASGEGSSYEVTTPDPTTAEPGNEIPDKNDKEVVEAGGVEEELSRVEHSSAQRQLFEWWSLSLTVCLLCIPLIA